MSASWLHGHFLHMGTYDMSENLRPCRLLKGNHTPNICIQKTCALPCALFIRQACTPRKTKHPNTHTHTNNHGSWIEGSLTIRCLHKARGFTQPQQQQQQQQKQQPQQPQQQQQQQQQQRQQLLDDHFTFFDLFLPCTIYDVLTSWGNK